MREFLVEKELMRLNWKSIKRLQNARFRAVAHCLLPHTKAYSDLFFKHSVNPLKIRCVDDWQKFGLPLFKKKFYLRNPSLFVVSPDAKIAFSVYKKFLSKLDKTEALCLLMTALFQPKTARLLVKSFFSPKMPFFSGGTESGAPTPVFVTSRQKFLLGKIVGQIVSVINRVNDFNGDSVAGMNLFPYGPHLAWHASQIALDLAADFNLNTAAGGAIPTESLARLANKFSVKIFTGMHSYMKDRFFPAVVAQKSVLPVRALIINGACRMSAGDREQLVRVCQKAGIIQPLVLDMYGASELKEDLMPECCPGSGFHHIAPLSAIVRTVKAETTADEEFISKWEFTLPEDGGFAAIWNIDGAGSLFEGYLIGDHYRKVSQDVCQHCGLRVERIYDVSRIRDIKAQQELTGVVEQKIKGARIELTALRDKLLALDFVEEVQLVVGKGGKNLIIRFASKIQSNKAIVMMKKSIEILEVTPKIEFVPIDKLVLPNKKFEPFVVK